MKKLIFILLVSLLSTAQADEVEGFKFLGIQLDKSNLKDVKDALGEGDIYQKLDPTAKSLTYMCYKTKSLQLELGSSEMAGNHITEFKFGPVQSRRRSAHCKPVKKFDSKTKFDNGIGLGLEKSEIIKLLGSPKEDKGNELIYSLDKYTLEVDLDKSRKARVISIFKNIDA